MIGCVRTIGLRDVDERVVGAAGGDPRRERAVVVVGIGGTQALQPLLHLGCEQVVRGAHVHEARVAAAARWKLPRVQHRERRRDLGVRVVDVERLEQTGTLVVAAERNGTELRALLVGQHEAGIDDLHLRVVAHRGAVARPPDRILDRAEHLGDAAKGMLVERLVDAQADDAVLGERGAQRIGRPPSARSRCGTKPTTSATPNEPDGACTASDPMAKSPFQP